MILHRTYSTNVPYFFYTIFMLLNIMLPQQKTKLFTVLMATTLLSLGSLSLPLDVFASHSFEAGVIGDNIPDNTHVNLNEITLEHLQVVPLYDASPNFVSGHFLLQGPCDERTHEPLVSVIAGHIDESTDNTYVDWMPLYYISHASFNPGTCIYHAHIPDPLNGGSPRITDVDLVNFNEQPISFKPGDAVDINVQRSLGNIEDFYENNPDFPTRLPADLLEEFENGQNNPVFDLNDNNPDNDGLGHQ